MSGHERERLSAYLDDELPAAERSAVEAHLARCVECAACLERLAAVDRTLADQRWSAPEAYFETFAARVRARLEAQGLPRRPWPFVPASTWALAAALFLAVVTPVVLFEPAQPPKTATRGLSAETPKAAPERGAPATAQHLVRDRAAPESLTPQTAVPRTARESLPGSSHRPSPMAAERHAKVALAVDAASPAEEDRPFAAAPALSEKPADDQLGRVAAGAAASSPSSAPPLAAPPLPVAVGARERGAAQAPRARDETPPAAFRRLEAEQPANLDGWRRLRDAWRSFARARPADDLAEEALVHGIEAGAEAYRRGGAAEDLAALRDDATRYLARADARQKEQVRHLMAGFAGTP